MVVDTTLTFAARRHVPTRYSRDLVAKTLTAMQRVEEIKARRERVFYKNRMAGNKQREREANRKLVEENQHLLPKNMREAVTVEEEKMVVDEAEERETVKVKVPLKMGKRKQLLARADGMDVD
jgi:large subunit ribosomal protein L24e